MPVLSICIPTYNRCRFLMQNLMYFYKHNKYDFEVVISDNASTDDTNERVNVFIAEKNVGNFKYYRNPENIGPDANFKKVLSLGTGKYSLLLGDDDFLKDDFFDQVIPFLIKYDRTFVSLSSKEMVKKSDGESFRNFNIDEMDEFLVLIGPHITFMSIMIFKSEILHIVLKKDFKYEANLYQSFLAINTIQSNVEKEYAVFFYNPFSFNGDTSAENYDFYTVFINRIIDLYKVAMPDENEKRILEIYRRSFGYFIFKFTVILKAIGVKKKLNKKQFDILKYYPYFWFVILPGYLIPSPLLSVLYKQYKKMR